MKRNQYTDHREPYIVRSEKNYWIWVLIALFLGYYIVSKHGWSMGSMIVPCIPLFLAIVSYLGRKETIVMNSDGIHVYDENIPWKDIKKCEFVKESGHRAGGFWVLNIVLKDDYEKKIHIEDYKYDCDEFCAVFNSYCRKHNKAHLSPHISKTKEGAFIIFYLVAFVVLLFIAYNIFRFL